MKEALKQIKTQIAVGVILSGVAAAGAYALEAREAWAATERTIAKQVGEIEERIALAQSELDAVTAFITEARPDISVVNNYINGLSLSGAKNVPWLWSVVAPGDELPALVDRIRAQPSMENFAIRGAPGPSGLSAPIILANGLFDAKLVGSDLMALPELTELAAEANRAAYRAPRGALLTITATGFPAETIYMMRFVAPASGRYQGITRPGLVLRGLTASNLLRSAQLADGQALRILDETTRPARPLLLAGSNPEMAAWLPNVSFPIGDHRLGLSLSPPHDRPRLGWWLLVFASGILLTGLFAALRSGSIVGQRAYQLGSVLSSTEQRLAETERREIAFFENTGTANCETDFRTGNLLRVNESLCTLLGYSRDELIGRTFSDITHPDDIALSLSARIDSDGQPIPRLQFEKRYLRKDGTTVWGLVNSKLHYNETGQPRSYMTVIINIDDRKRDEITKALLTRELAHRVRNTVQLTSSLARQTATTARSVKDYDLKFHRRLAALSAAQDILFDRNWMSAPLSRIAQATFKPFLPENPKQGDLSVNLPDVELPTQQAQTIAIALHELASNSSRYGALSNGGTVSVVGTVLDDGDDGQILQLRWDEQSTRPVRRPRKAGFGTRMLMSAMPEQFGGHAKATWRASGLLYEAWLKLPPAVV